MGLRTEDILIAHENTQRQDQFSFTTTGQIRIIEPLGNETNLHMDLQGADLVSKAEGRRAFRVGESLKMTLDLTHLHIFDAESKQSIY